MNLLSLLFSDPLAFVAFVIVFLMSLSVHEASHALAGYLLGDMTAKRANRLTLNPFAHVDLLGFVALVTIGFGWGKPVPFNPYQLKYPRWGPVLVAGAGPTANLLVGTLCAFAYRFLEPGLGPMNLLTVMLSSAAFLNFALLLFNLIPVPPLDGSKALLAVLDAWNYRRAAFLLERQGPMLLLLLIVLDTLSPISFFGWLSHASQALFSFLLHI